MSLENAGLLCVKNTFFDEVTALMTLEMKQSKSCFCRPVSDSDASDDVEDTVTPSLSADEEPSTGVCSLRTWSGCFWDAASLNRKTHRAAGGDWMQFMDSDTSYTTACTKLPGIPAGCEVNNPEDSEDDEFPTCRLRTMSWSSCSDGRHESFWSSQQGADSLCEVESTAEACSFPTSELAQSVLGQVWELSQTAQGCREVQDALEEPGSEEARRAITLELQTHIAEGLFCPYANFVLQKCIAILSEEDLDFFFQELMAAGPEKAAKHKFGCRVTQRLASKNPETWGVAIGEAILCDFESVACHPYGNYVVQHLLENGAESTRTSLAAFVLEQMSSLVSNTFGAAVVAGAMKTALQADQVSLARALLTDSDSLVALALSRHGHGSVMASLDLVTGEESRAAIVSLQQESDALSATKFGRAVLAALETEKL
eukprot:CAMPEP_0206445306 /NCGR_PEP_ID=MMETSP0324_2-20121206/15431_1 /ASSEMBLY_ACC=CAM_ASM_000836 /TAXON_ID=2866 /ORGANISM="Crypthecodinium cohnii, Strain Seligo" /LENGTH=428 /DNA_ID=CAMNT_0053913499 /DNA_START=98 /DNA_END=1384 /DNA_ORIENTATION=+